MAEGDAIEVKGRFNTSTRITMLLKVWTSTRPRWTCCVWCSTWTTTRPSRPTSCSTGERGSSPLQSTTRGNHAPCSRTPRLSYMLPRVAALIIREAPVKLNRRFKELASAMSGQSAADSGPPRTMAELMSAHRKVSKGSCQLLCDDNRRAVSLSPRRSLVYCTYFTQRRSRHCPVGCSDLAHSGLARFAGAGQVGGQGRGRRQGHRGPQGHYP